MGDALLTNQSSASTSSVLNYINLSSAYTSGAMWQGSFTNAKYGIFLIMNRYAGTQDYYGIAHCNVNESVTVECIMGFSPGVRAIISLYNDHVILTANDYELMGVSAIIYYE